MQPHDLARLLLVEFATVYGNDWLVVPVDLPVGSYTEVSASHVHDDVRRDDRASTEADDAGRTGTLPAVRGERWRVGADTLPGLFVPPSVVGVLDGPAIEDVLFLRDEMANKAWAVERLVQNADGDPRNRNDEPKPGPVIRGATPDAELDYLLQTEVPANWIPFVPVMKTIADGAVLGSSVLKKGAMLAGAAGAGAEVLAEGVLLEPTPMTLHDAEVPREGVRVRRVPALARSADGNYHRWITRRVNVGRGEGASGLAFDSAFLRSSLPPS